MPPALLDLLYLPLALAYLPVLLYRIFVLGKSRRGWGERFGAVTTRDESRSCIWIHAVSLGEVNATATLISQIEKRLPQCDVVISTTTETGYAAATKKYPGKLVFRFPIDFSFIVRKVLRRLRPATIILMELEVWPNFITVAQQAGIPIGIANGRVTEEKSMRRFRKPIIRGLARSMFRQITWVAAQNGVYAERFRELGVSADRIVVTGNLKYDTAQVGDADVGTDALAVAMCIDRRQPLIVAGSTGPGEEEILLETFRRLRAERPGLQLCIVPRKPERFEEVARLIRDVGFLVTRRGERPDGSPASPQFENVVLLGDTMGELRKFYSLANVVFVGRSLVPLGGSDLMEVAALAKPLCFGPHVENFSDVAEQLLAARAAQRVNSSSDLYGVLQQLLARPDESATMGKRAREVILQHTGATTRTVDLLMASLHPSPTPAGVRTKPVPVRSV